MRVSHGEHRQRRPSANSLDQVKWQTFFDKMSCATMPETVKNQNAFSIFSGQASARKIGNKLLQIR